MTRHGGSIDGDEVPLGRLGRWLGNPLEWTDVQKSILLFLPPMPFVVFYILRIERLLAHPEFEPYIDRPSILLVEHMLFALLAIFVILTTIWAFLRRSKREHRGFVATSIHTWFISMGLASYAVGPFSSPVLVGFLAGGMTAFLLYDVRRATLGAAIGMAVIVLTTLLERMRVLPYGPVFAGVAFGGRRPPDTWVFWNLVFTLVLVGFVLGGVGLLMTIARRRQAEIARLLRIDPLTGLANRRTFDEALELEVSRARRTSTPLSLVLFDLDHFKRVNDTHGHRAGDAVLAAAAESLRAASREIDVAARYGGEELALLLPATDTSGAEVAAERVRAAIEALEVPTDGAGAIRVTTSAGCASVRGAGATASAVLVKAADDALYRAKAEGRNRVVVDRTRPSSFPPASRG